VFARLGGSLGSGAAFSGKRGRTGGGKKREEAKQVIASVFRRHWKDSKTAGEKFPPLSKEGSKGREGF